jgi:hypothetical protein
MHKPTILHNHNNSVPSSKHKIKENKHLEHVLYLLWQGFKERMQEKSSFLLLPLQTLAWIFSSKTLTTQKSPL